MSFFYSVLEYGGFNEVVKAVGTWSKIWKNLSNFDPSITDASFRLKRNYERFLLDYEYHKYPQHRQAIIDQLKAGIAVPAGVVVDNSLAPSSPLRPKSKRPAKRRTQNCVVRSEVPRDARGNPVMPLSVSGGVIIESLGTILAHPPFVTDKHVWPVGFTSVRSFSSMFSKNKRVKYVSQIANCNGAPQFIVTAMDDPQHPIVSNSPSGAWRVVLSRVMQLNGSTRIQRPSVSVSGSVRFGLAHPIVAQLLQEQPQAQECKAKGLGGWIIHGVHKTSKKDSATNSDINSVRSDSEDTPSIGSIQNMPTLSGSADDLKLPPLSSLVDAYEQPTKRVRVERVRAEDVLAGLSGRTSPASPVHEAPGTPPSRPVTTRENSAAEALFALAALCS
jgi:hypothetical protein